jgi:hypothetical protein
MKCLQGKQEPLTGAASDPQAEHLQFMWIPCLLLSETHLSVHSDQQPLLPPTAQRLCRVITHNISLIYVYSIT